MGRPGADEVGERFDVGGAAVSEPTMRQMEAVRVFASLQRSTGMPPTHRELCDALGHRSTNATNDVLKALEKKGYAVRVGDKFASRRWRLTPLAVSAVFGNARCPHCRRVIPREATP